MPEILGKGIYMADGERYRENKNADFSHVTICSKSIWKKTTEELQVTLDGWRLLEWTEVQPVTERGGKGTGTLYKGNLTRRGKKLFA